MRSLISTLAVMTLLGLASVAEAQTVAVLFNGASARVGESGGTGMDQLKERLTDAFRGQANRTFSTQVFEFYQTSQAVEFINDDSHRRGCLVLIGHSMGAAAAMQVARDLPDDVDSVALLVQLDSWGADDDHLPDRVERGVNYFQKSTFMESGDVTDLQGLDWVNGSDNYRVEAVYRVCDDKVTHTNIDDGRFGFEAREYRTKFRAQRDLHARIRDLVAEACPQ